MVLCEFEEVDCGGAWLVFPSSKDLGREALTVGILRIAEVRARNSTREVSIEVPLDMENGSNLEFLN